MDKDQHIDAPDPAFVKGFNEGYILSRYAPEIGNLLSGYVDNSERGKGFKEGREQYDYELTKDRHRTLEKDFADNKEDISKDKDNGRDSLLKDFSDNKEDMGVGKSKDHYTDWLKDMDENKTDMDLDREPEKDMGDIEPELD